MNTDKDFERGGRNEKNIYYVRLENIMKSVINYSLLLFFVLIVLWGTPVQGFERIKYNNPGLVVDLGVGLWALPLPMDYDGDGDYDLVVGTNDVPYNGSYFFENTSGNVKYPIFKPSVRLGKAAGNLQISYTGKSYHIMTPGFHYPEFKVNLLDAGTAVPFKPSFYTGRANQWNFCDYDGDGVIDLIIGASDWREYGWDNAFNSEGKWTNGPLHGYVYFIRNAGTDAKPKYEEAVLIKAGDTPIDVYGMPSPNLADFDGDSDLDIICGEFLDKLTYFENTGTRQRPRYAEGKYLKYRNEIITMDLEMIGPEALDWDSDGDIDLVVGQEDGRVALMEHTGSIKDGIPGFLPPKFFQQQADEIKYGALVTPFSYDWDDDGDEDLICGNTAGYISFVENLDSGNPPKWAAPRDLAAGGKIFRIMAGYNGSIQGPAEAKWGYTVLNVADWDHDGLPDIVVNSITGEVQWLKNSGTRNSPKLESPRPVEVEWKGTAPKPAWFWWNPKGNQLVTQWRTSPVVKDINGDGLNDLVMLDHEGYLSFFERRKMNKTLQLLPGERIFMNETGEPLRMNENKAGGSGRRKFILADWDNDGKLDLLVNSKSVNFMRNIANDSGRFVFRDEGPVHSRVLAGHTTCPAVVDWDNNGIPDLLAGAEDGFLYYLRNPQSGK